jgi:cytochrome c biogenesis protein
LTESVIRLIFLLYVAGKEAMKTTQPEKGKLSLWKALASVNLTLVLLILIAITSIFGTLIPQQERALELAHRLSPGLVTFLGSLQVFDLYHSYWFRFLIGALALNLIVCSLDRFPSSLKLFRSSPTPERTKPFENLPSHRMISAGRDMSEVVPEVIRALRNKFRKVEKKEVERTTYVYAEKGRHSYFGVYLVHFSVLLILVGGIVGSFFGFEAFVTITEGDTAQIVTLRKTEVAKELPFGVRCDKFVVDFYENGAPKEYRSDLAFILNGKVAMQGALLVNHPLSFMGITFYQSTYGTIAGKNILLSVSRGDSSEKMRYEMKVGEPVTLPGSSAQFQVVEVRSDFMRMGPAVHVDVKPSQGEEVHLWVFQNQEMIKQRFPGMLERFPKLNPRAFEPYTFFLEKIEAKYYTGLQVNRDPGVNLVYLGFCFMVLGLIVTFFVSHRRVWIQISGEKRKVSVKVAGRANKNQPGFEKKLDELAEKLRKSLD